MLHFPSHKLFLIDAQSSGRVLWLSGNVWKVAAQGVIVTHNVNVNNVWDP